MLLDEIKKYIEEKHDALISVTGQTGAGMSFSTVWTTNYIDVLGEADVRRS